MSWSAYASGGFVGLAEEWIYHRWFEEKQPRVKPPPQELALPRMDDGAAVPLIYGRCRVRQPILSWCNVPQYGTNGFSPAVYQMDLFFVLGRGFGDGTHGLHGMWHDDRTPFEWHGRLLDGADPTGDGAFESPVLADIGNLNGSYVGGHVEFLNGGATQTVVDDTGTATTFVGTDILSYWAADDVPGYRGLLSAYLSFSHVNGGQWRLGDGATIPAYSFEASSYKAEAFARIGPDSNPITVLYDLLVDKLGIPSTYIDDASFDAAAVTLYNESHGYSRCIGDIREAGEHIVEILRQIDAALYFDESTSTFKITLVRNDYDPSTIPHITKNNCVDLVNFAAGSFYNLPNKIRLVFENAADNYLDGSSTARNQANAVGQDGVQIEHLIEMRGCTNVDLASRLAARELAALSRPIAKCRAIVDRSFIRVNPGDPIKVTWSTPDVSSVIFRVAGVDRGTLENGQIALDLIQDYYYSFRGRVPQPPGLVDRGIVRGGTLTVMG